MKTISDVFGSLVFNDAVMQARLPKETYQALQGNHPRREAGWILRWPTSSPTP